MHCEKTRKKTTPHEKRRREPRRPRVDRQPRRTALSAATAPPAGRIARRSPSASPHPCPRGQIEVPPQGRPSSATRHAGYPTCRARVVPGRGPSSPRRKLELVAPRCWPPRRSPPPSPRKYRSRRLNEPPPLGRSPAMVAGLGPGAVLKLAPPPSPHPRPSAPPCPNRPPPPWPRWAQEL